jgi:hypothetical protein
VRNLKKFHIKQNPNPNILKAIGEAATIRAPIRQRAALKLQEHQQEQYGTPIVTYNSTAPPPPSYSSY